MLSTGFINVLQSWGQVCPFHTSTPWPIWGKERKCKKEMSVGRHPEEVVIRMMAWWVAQGFLEQRWVFVVTCVPITSSSQQCWCRHHTLTRWIWIRAETFVDVVVRYSPTWSHGPNVCHSDSMWLDSAKDTSLSADLTRPMRNFADATYWWYLAQHHDQSIPWKLKMHFLSDAQFVPVAVLCVLALECGTQPVSPWTFFWQAPPKSVDELPSLDELKDEIQHYSALGGGILAGSWTTLVTFNFDVGSKLIPDCCDSMLPLAMLCMNCSSRSCAKLIMF